MISIRDCGSLRWGGWMEMDRNDGFKRFGSKGDNDMTTHHTC